MSIEEVMLSIKNTYEETITTGIFNGQQKKNGLEAKQALIRSSKLINCLHEYIKEELIRHHIAEDKIFPRRGETKPELKLTGLLKQKKQDISIKPTHIESKKEKISWGPLAFEEVYDSFGKELTEQILTINVRSQLSSLAKNTDTLFERTIAEATNLHEVHPNMVTGEVYLIPTHEFNDDAMKENRVEWSSNKVNLEKYISFFHQISGRKDQLDGNYKYERCALLIVDFRQPIPKIYQSIDELKQDGLVEPSFQIDYRSIDLKHFIVDLINTYHERFNLLHLV